METLWAGYCHNTMSTMYLEYTRSCAVHRYSHQSTLQVLIKDSTRTLQLQLFVTGLTIDNCVSLPQETRNFIAESILKLVFRYL